MEGMARGLKAVADLILPRTCIVCGRKLLLDEKHICLFCLADMPQTRHWTMKHNPMADRFNAVIQKGLEAAWDEYGVEKVGTERYVYATALFFYDMDAGYRHIPYHVKYHGDRAAGKHFGKMLGKRLSYAPWLKDVDAVVPVPLHWFRRWERGYNQAEIIAEGVTEIIDAPLRTDILKRIRYTRTQTKLDIRSKAQNVEGAFLCKQHRGNGLRHILLIDDVFTTGATLYACYAALRSVFPSSVRISIATLGFVGD